MAFTDFIAPISGAATGLLGNAVNVYMQNRQNEENQRLAQQNNQWNIDQWNRANEYNMPANQMKRLRDAGLNTSLMYGSPTNVAISSPQADTSNKGQAPKVDFNSLISNAQQMMLQQQLTKAQIDNINADTASKSLQNEEKSQEKPFFAENARYKSDALLFNSQNAEKMVEQTQANINHIKEDRQRIYQANEMMRENWIELSDQVQQQYKITKSQAEQAATQAAILAKELFQMDDRFQIFKDLSAEQINQAKSQNTILGIDASNYKKLMGDPNNTNALGPIMFFLKAIMGMIGAVK